MLRSAAVSAYTRISFLILSAAFAGRIGAQEKGSVQGSVSDSAGAPIFRAELAVEGSDLRAHTDEHGTFRLDGLQLGAHMLTARRLGFSPVRVQFELSQAAGARVAVRMNPLAATLAPVVVRQSQLQYTGRLADYYKRLERKSSGYFITRQDIDRENPTTLGQLLQHVPGIRVAREGAGITGMRMRGRTCWPLVWLDGTPMSAGETDLDSFVPSSLQGIELYLGSTTAPIRYIYNRDLSSCGTVLLWSRGPDTDPVGRTTPSVDLEALINRVEIYSADQVDSPARLDAAHPFQLDYPPALYAARERGLVIAEFVVDTLGRVEDSTFGIVSATAPSFSDAVRRALHSASYVPAIKDGHPVRQLVQQPFTFDFGGSDRAAHPPQKLDPLC
jgi:TonB family protein